MSQPIQAVVTEVGPDTVTIQSDDHPVLKWGMQVSFHQVAPAVRGVLKIGDRVLAQYKSGASRGLWHVTNKRASGFPDTYDALILRSAMESYHGSPGYRSAVENGIFEEKEYKDLYRRISKAGGYSVMRLASPSAERVAKKWKRLPKGWTEESVKKFWGTITKGNPEHPVSECIKRMKGKMDNPAPFCAGLADEMIPGWRQEVARKRRMEKEKAKGKKATGPMPPEIKALGDELRRIGVPHYDDPEAFIDNDRNGMEDMTKHSWDWSDRGDEWVLGVFRPDPKEAHKGWRKVESQVEKLFKAFRRKNPSWMIRHDEEELQIWKLKKVEELEAEKQREIEEIKTKIQGGHPGPSNFSAFTKLLARALKGAQFLPEHIRDAIDEEGLNDALYSAWEAIEWEEGDAKRRAKKVQRLLSKGDISPRDLYEARDAAYFYEEPFLQRHAEAIADGLVELIDWHNNPWNFGPGEAPKKIKIDGGLHQKILQGLWNIRKASQSLSLRPDYGSSEAALPRGMASRVVERYEAEHS